MHRSSRQPLARRLISRLRKTVRSWLDSRPRRALDLWCAAIETELAARPWAYREPCYSADCLYCEGNRVDVAMVARRAFSI